MGTELVHTTCGIGVVDRGLLDSPRRLIGLRSSEASVD
jgi:hypothetical protein